MIITDWASNNLFFIWPCGISGRDHLTHCILPLIEMIPLEISITLITTSKKASEQAVSSISRFENTGRVKTIVLPEVKDIWIRDWAPVVLEDSGGKFFVKAMYQPQYLKGDDVKYAHGDDSAGRKLAKHFDFPQVVIPLVWDLGNFTHNGLGTAIVTRRILEDNPEYDESAIRVLFNKHLGIDDLIFMDVEPGDVTGHVDGTVRFLNEHILAVALYPDTHTQENDWLNDLVGHLQFQLGSDFTIFRIPNGEIEDLVTEGFPSAFGNHLNFLRAGNSLLLPCYDIDEDDEAISAIRRNCPQIDVIPVGGEGVRELSRLGGVFNCISWGM